MRGSWVLGFPWDSGIRPQEPDPTHKRNDKEPDSCVAGWGGSLGPGFKSQLCHVYGLESNLAFLGLRVLICKTGLVRPT